jgi:heme-degrading monooxygenase HmoA
MYTSTFIFAKKEFDDEFHALDQTIAAAAKAIPGYLGEETWENPANGLVSNVYYWETLEALQVLMKDPSHQLAKAGHAKWLDGYRVVIAEVRREYGIKGLGLTAAP